METLDYWMDPAPLRVVLRCVREYAGGQCVMRTGQLKMLVCPVGKLVYLGEVSFYYMYAVQ